MIPFLFTRTHAEYHPTPREQADIFLGETSHNNNCTMSYSLIEATSFDYGIF